MRFFRNTNREERTQGLAKLLRARLPQQRDDGKHLDGNTVLAFCEQRLSSVERNAALQHLAVCSVCREVVALSSPSAGPLQGRRLRMPWRFVAALAVSCLVLVCVWLPSAFEAPPPPLPQVQIAPAEQNPLLLAKVPVPPPEVKTQQRRRAQVVPKIQAEREMARAKAAAAAAAPATAVVGGNLPSFGKSTPVVASFRPDAFRQISPEDSLRLYALSGRPQTVWALGSNPGYLQRSDDGGQTWRGVLVQGGARFFSLAAKGPEIWVGGDQGKLLHSPDDGTHWTALPVKAGARPLNQPITGIEVRPAEMIVKTPTGASWASFDGGAHWQDYQH